MYHQPRPARFEILCRCRRGSPPAQIEPSFQPEDNAPDIGCRNFFGFAHLRPPAAGKALDTAMWLTKACFSLQAPLITSVRS
jgi:hypothetical protein